MVIYILRVPIPKTHGVFPKFLFFNLSTETVHGKGPISYEGVHDDLPRVSFPKAHGVIPKVRISRRGVRIVVSSPRCHVNEGSIVSPGC